MPASVGSRLEVFGYEIVSDVLSHIEIEELISALGQANGPGRRGVLSLPTVAKLATSARLLEAIRGSLRAEPRPVRAIYFDKTPETNWAVGWHQDLTIAVSDRADVADFGPWSVKDGVPHVQPPAELLEQMLTIRLHLDDCNADNGALWVLPGSHTLGRLSAEQIQEMTQRQQAVVCTVNAGGALFMKPLLLHSSKRSAQGVHRRVLHLEYAGFDLPKPLEWKQPRRPGS